MTTLVVPESPTTKVVTTNSCQTGAKRVESPKTFFTILRLLYYRSKFQLVKIFVSLSCRYITSGKGAMYAENL